MAAAVALASTGYNSCDRTNKAWAGTTIGSARAVTMVPPSVEAGFIALPTEESRFESRVRRGPQGSSHPLERGLDRSSSCGRRDSL